MPAEPTGRWLTQRCGPASVAADAEGRSAWAEAAPTRMRWLATCHGRSKATPDHCRRSAAAATRGTVRWRWQIGHVLKILHLSGAPPYICLLTDEYRGLYSSVSSTFFGFDIEEYKKLEEGTLFSCSAGLMVNSGRILLITSMHLIHLIMYFVVMIEGVHPFEKGYYGQLKLQRWVSGDRLEIVEGLDFGKTVGLVAVP
jgi:hypothetical protein